jgi:hypothetical protein
MKRGCLNFMRQPPVRFFDQWPESKPGMVWYEAYPGISVIIRIFNVSVRVRLEVFIGWDWVWDEFIQT